MKRQISLLKGWAEKAWNYPAMKTTDVVVIWRERIFSLAFISLALIGVFPLYSSLKYSFLNGEVLYASSLIAIYLVVLVVTFLRNMPFPARAWLGLSTYYAYGIVSLINVGPTGSVRIWLLSLSIIASLFLGLRASMAVLALTTGTIFAAGWAINNSILAWTPYTMNSVAEGWAVTSVTFAFLNVVTTIALGALVRNMERILRNEQKLTLTLSEINQRLREEIAERKKAEKELLQAYDATLEGWAKALEMRDQETSGHTQRAVNMTLELAKALNIPEEELINIRRGALLHDIGKMGIPDSILRKPGDLTKEEWEIMKQHTHYAYEWLAPIEYLHAALDIPRYHHEKWDGTGYPHGLKREEVPLAARIFAVVDMWDALCSDRPYRNAWQKEKATVWIKEHAGRDLDPNIVEVFIRLIEDENPVLLCTERGKPC